MGRPKGCQKSGGRKRGTPNKKTLLEEKLRKLHFDPTAELVRELQQPVTAFSKDRAKILLDMHDFIFPRRARQDEPAGEPPAAQPVPTAPDLKNVSTAQLLSLVKPIGSNPSNSPPDPKSSS
jgi:hypothetical protein